MKLLLSISIKKKLKVDEIYETWMFRTYVIILNVFVIGLLISQLYSIPIFIYFFIVKNEISLQMVTFGHAVGQIGLLRQPHAAYLHFLHDIVSSVCQSAAHINELVCDFSFSLVIHLNLFQFPQVNQRNAASSKCLV